MTDKTPRESTEQQGSTLVVTERTKVKRYPDRGVYERKQINDILDESLTCVFAFCPVDKFGFRKDKNEVPSPVCIPQSCVRFGDYLLTHGKTSSMLMKHLANGFPVTVTATLLDGIVMAKSGFHHSMNYRSVVIFGVAEEVVDEKEKLDLLNHIVNDLTYQGRADECRPITKAEIVSTTVTKIKIEEASAKVRNGPAGDDKADLSYPAWAGVLPIRMVAEIPEPAAHNTAKTPVGIKSIPRFTRKAKTSAFSRRNEVLVAIGVAATSLVLLSLIKR